MMKKGKIFDGRKVVTYIPDGGINLCLQKNGCFRRLKNMYIDRKSGLLTSFIGFRRLFSFDSRIHSIFSLVDQGEKRIYVHAGCGLYVIDVKDENRKRTLKQVCSLSDNADKCCHKGNIGFIADGERLVMVKKSEAIEVSRDPIYANPRLLFIFDGRLFAISESDENESPLCLGKIAECGLLADDTSIPYTSFGADIISVLPRGEELWIFKSFDDGAGSIICLKRQTEGEYAVCERFFGIRPICSGVGYNDDILFLTNDGLFSVSEIDGRKRIICRTRSIGSDITKPDICNAKITQFYGYVVLFLGEKMYVGDSEYGAYGDYAWYLIDGVGSYKNDRRIFNYSTERIDGYKTSPDTDRPAKGEIFSLINEDGREIFYEQGDGERILVYPTNRFFGGDFFAATDLFSDGEAMIFSTECDDLCIFNSDIFHKIGNSEDINDYSTDELTRLYSFCNHPPEYLVEYAPDDLGLPNTAKETVRHSTLVRMASVGEGDISVRIVTDGEESYFEKIRLGGLDFSRLDFEGLSASAEEICSVILPERTRGWREKQIVIESGSAPITIEKVSYSYRPIGRIKKSL